MKEETLKALKESIEHWERLAAGTSSPLESIFTDDCALCEMYNFEEFCSDECPVKAKTGLPSCKNTPWLAVDDALEDHGKESKSFISAAKVQLEFLKSLLPKTKKQYSPKNNRVK